MSDRVILDHKKSYLVYLKIFIFVIFSDFQQKFAKSEKITKNKNFQNRPNMTFYGLK